MSPRRQSKTRSRSAGRASGSRGGKSTAARGRSHSRSARASGASRGNSRRASSAGRGARGAPAALKLLKQDHRAVAQALEEFESAGRDEKQSLARRICRMLAVHAQIEEELLYPAAREALGSRDAHLVAEARVEHASLKDLIRQIEDREQMDEQYEAKVRVLGEYVKHHVGEEEHELFPRLERSPLDLRALGERLAERKRELMGEEPGRLHDAQGMHEEEEESPTPGGRSRGGRGQRPAAVHARRR
jgi:hemerythrin-like domain-containing protein